MLRETGHYGIFSLLVLLFNRRVRMAKNSVGIYLILRQQSFEEKVNYRHGFQEQMVKRYLGL